MTSIPFSFPARLMGIVETSGLIHGEGPDLVVDTATNTPAPSTGSRKSCAVPLTQIESVNLKRGWFGSAKLVVQTKSLAAVAKLPESDHGRVEFKLAKRDRPAAEKLVERRTNPGREPASKRSGRLLRLTARVNVRL